MHRGQPEGGLVAMGTHSSAALWAIEARLAAWDLAGSPLREPPSMPSGRGMLETMSISGSMKMWAKRIKRDGVTLWFAGKNPPVLGYVDDVLLLPGLIWLTIKLLPPEVLAECRVQADDWMQTKGAKPTSRVGAVLVVLLWLAVGAAAWFWLQPRL